MNSELKSFLEEATEFIYNPFTGRLEQKVDYKVFAELIVQKCMQIAAKRAGGPYQLGMTRETQTAWNIYMDIADRFGTTNEKNTG